MSDAEAPSELYARVRLEMINAERTRVLEVRSQGQVPSEIVSEVLGMLDIEESMLDAGTQARASIRSANAETLPGHECVELEAHRPIAPAGPDEAAVCEECLAGGGTWVALRRCLDCGNVGCCDSSIGRHATNHFHDTGHAVMQSAEPGETWRWCYVHHLSA